MNQEIVSSDFEELMIEIKSHKKTKVIAEKMRNCHNCKFMAKGKRLGLGSFKCMEYLSLETDCKPCLKWEIFE